MNNNQQLLNKKLLAVLGFISLIQGCGVDNNYTAGVSSGGTGSFSSGVVSGYGSIIVNDIRFDESTADIKNEDGVSGSRDQLKLGMFVQVLGGEVSVDTATNMNKAIASKIVFSSAIVGPVSSSNDDSLTVLGSTVSISSSTVIDGCELGYQNQYVTVYGLNQPQSNRIKATRIECQSNRPLTYQLTGKLQRLDDTNKVLYVNDQRIEASSGVILPNPLKVGQLVKIKIDAARSSTNTELVATDVQIFAPSITPPTKAGKADIEGVVTEFNSMSSFKIDGMLVDASGINPLPSVAVGDHVKAHGAYNGSVFVCNRLNREKEDDDDDYSPREFKFIGKIDAVNKEKRTITIKGQVVSYSDSTEFEELQPSDLAVGLLVKVKGNLNRETKQFIAREIELAD